MNNLTKLLIIICLFPATVFSQTWQWEKRDGVLVGDKAHAICTDGLGNFYIAASSSGQEFISKYNSSGTNIWKDSINPLSYTASICYYNGYLYYTGDSIGNIFVFKYDLNGNFIWKTYCGLGRSNGIASDNSGHIYVTGNTTFFTKLDTAGNIVWMRNTSAVGNSVSTDLANNIYITGCFFDTTLFGTHTLIALGDRDIFIAKYDSSGNCIWAKRAGGSHGPGYSYDSGNGIISDSSGHLYITGSFVDTADFNSITLSSPHPGNNDIFLAKYDTSGNAIWVQQATGTSDQEGRCIAIDYQGNILIGGSYVPSLYFNSYQLNGWGNYDAFVAKYDPNGNFISVISAGGPTWNDYVYGICADNAGNIFAVGDFSYTAYFGTDSLTSQGNYDVFIGKIDFTTEINEQSNNLSSVLLYPNPVSDFLAIQLTNPHEKNLQIKILDILGQTVIGKKENLSIDSGSNGNFETLIDVSGLNPGVYVISIKSGEIELKQKFLIQR